MKLGRLKSEYPRTKQMVGQILLEKSNMQKTNGDEIPQSAQERDVMYS